MMVATRVALSRSRHLLHALRAGSSQIQTQRANGQLFVSVSISPDLSKEAANSELLLFACAIAVLNGSLSNSEV